MSLAEIQTLAASASASLAAGDYDAALVAVQRAQALLIGVPDSEKNGEAIRYRDRQLSDLVKSIERGRSRTLAATAAGVQRTKITRARVSS